MKTNPQPTPNLCRRCKRKVLNYPNKPGFWISVRRREILEVYDLEPVGMLCYWDDDWSCGAILQPSFWDDDEFVGHAPSSGLYLEGKWIFAGETEDAANQALLAWNEENPREGEKDL